MDRQALAPPGFTGLIAAPFTAFRPDGELDLEKIPDQAALLREGGVAGAFVCGTTGEGTSLSTAERKRVAERWLKSAGGLEVIVHAGHASVAEAKDLARHAAAIGSAAVAVTAPFYFRPSAVGDLVPFLADVANAAPALPFFYYDIPSTTGVLLPTAQVMRRLREVVPNLGGVKFSNPDLMTMQECVGQGDRVLFGVDEYLLAAVVLGATGAVGSTYNYAAPVYRRMLAALAAGDLESARREQAKSAAMVRAVIDFGGVRAGKAIVGMLGVDCGPVRPPLRPVSREDANALYERLREMDVFTRALRHPSEPGR